MPRHDFDDFLDRRWSKESVRSTFKDLFPLEVPFVLAMTALGLIVHNLATSKGDDAKSEAATLPAWAGVLVGGALPVLLLLLTFLLHRRSQSHELDESKMIASIAENVVLKSLGGGKNAS